jgi:hypothetical protein
MTASTDRESQLAGAALVAAFIDRDEDAIRALVDDNADLLVLLTEVADLAAGLALAMNRGDARKACAMLACWQRHLIATDGTGL